MLDLGAYDETEIVKPQHKSWSWLHAEIAATAAEVRGVDASPRLRDSGSITTNCGTRIIYGQVEDLQSIVLDFRPDLIIAGELIEHTPDTIGWLSQLARDAPGTEIVLTTPNATSILNLALAFLNRENCHPDHTQIYSFKTLSTLAARVPILQPILTPYYYTSHLFQGRVPGVLAPVIAGIDLVFLRPIQYLFPLTAFGLILEGVFPGSREIR